MRVYLVNPVLHSAIVDLTWTVAMLMEDVMTMLVLMGIKGPAVKKVSTVACQK